MGIIGVSILAWLVFALGVLVNPSKRFNTLLNRSKRFNTSKLAIVIIVLPWIACFALSSPEIAVRIVGGVGLFIWVFLVGMVFGEE